MAYLSRNLILRKTLELMFLVAILLIMNSGVDLKTEKLNADLLKFEQIKVLKVIDGDTIDVLINGVTERVRLLGINTPETVDPRKTVECFGKEASEYAKLQLDGKLVTLEMDFTQGERDKYGRILAYVFKENGEMFNKSAISEGFAFEYTYNLPYKFQSEFNDLESRARVLKKGLWNTENCDY